jgi:hypothetical protein
MQRPEATTSGPYKEEKEEESIMGVIVTVVV